MKKSTSKVKSGRPTAKQAPLRLENILNIAAQVFLEEGFDRASVSAIARLAGASKETLYARYPSKEALFEAVIVRKTEILLRKFSRLLLSQEPVGKVLEAYGLNLLNLMLSPQMQRLNRTLIAAAPKFPELAESFWTLCPEREQAQLAGYLEGRITTGASKAAELFFSLCLGQFLFHAQLLVRRPPTRVARELHIHEVVKRFLAAYEV